MTTSVPDGIRGSDLWPRERSRSGGSRQPLTDQFDRGSTGTGFGNLWILLLGLGVAATLAALGLLLAIFRPTRDVGSILAAGGGAYAIGIVFGF